MRHAAIAQLVEHNLAKVGVASSSLVCRSKTQVAAMVELVDTRDLKSLGQKWLCGFESRSRHIDKLYTLNRYKHYNYYENS